MYFRAGEKMLKQLFFGHLSSGFISLCDLILGWVGSSAKTGRVWVCGVGAQVDCRWAGRPPKTLLYPLEERHAKPRHPLGLAARVCEGVGESLGKSSL